MKQYTQINENIASRSPCTSFEDNTYFTNELWEHFCEHRDYKYVAIFGRYKAKYRWTDAEALEMYNKSPDGWTDGIGVYRFFDWGRGENKLEKGEDWEWHDPQLDHIFAYARAKAAGWDEKRINHPSNFQVLPAIINRILSDMTDEQAPAILPVLLQQFPEYKI
jgi:hypothetical protein